MTAMMMIYGLAATAAGREWHAKHDIGLVSALGGDTATADPVFPPCTKGWYQQALDHTSKADTRLWNQQYQSNTQFWSSGGPVFLLLGGEGPASCLWLEHATAVMKYAEAYGAAVYQLEHRFYGVSQPFNSTPATGLSVENLEFLSSRQAISDAAAFTTGHIKKVHGDKATVISFGGSYSGALSAWLRKTYPDVIHGAVSTSSPILAQLDFTKYQEVVEASLSTTGPACAAGIKAATQQIQTQIATPAGRAALAKDYNTCAPIAEDDNAVANFMQNLAGSFDGVVQYNRDNRAWEHPGSATPPTITDVCAPFASNADPSKAYVSAQEIMTNFTSNCQDVSYPGFVAAMKNTSLDSDVAGGGRQWTWQTCVEFGYFQSSGSPSQPFGDLFPVSFSTQQCEAIYGVSTAATSQHIVDTNAFYGGLDYNTTRVIFVNGDIDPWHALSLGPKPGDPRGTTSVRIHGTAHCANMYPASPSDVAGLTAARHTVSMAIEDWLSQPQL